MRRLFSFLVFFIFLAGIFCPFSSASETPARRILFGPPQDTAESLFSSEGKLQAFPRGFTLEPLIENGLQWLSAAGAQKEITYQENRLPIPSVIWNFEDLRLEMEAFAWGVPEKGMVWARYRLISKAPHMLTGKLHFILKPSEKGSVRSAEFSEKGKNVRVNENAVIFLSIKPAEAGFLKREQGNILEKIKAHDLSQIHSVKDTEGFASGAWSYRFKLKPAGEKIFEIAIPLHPDGANLPGFKYDPLLIEARGGWRKKLDRVSLQIADSAMQQEVYLRLADLLILRDHPGVYSDYGTEDAWTENTLRTVQTYLDYGFLEEAREDLEMAALRVDDSGQVSIKMENKEKKQTLKSYRLYGEFVTAVWGYYNASHDKTWLAAKWPKVKAVLEYVKFLRAQRLTDWYSHRERKHFYGILPPSMDPVRGSAEPLHRYEDDLMASRAFKDGQKIADTLKLTAERDDFKKEEQLLRRALLESVELTASENNVRFIPEAADFPEMSPWPAAAAVWPAEEDLYFPAERLNYHFKNIREIFEKSKEGLPLKSEIFSGFETARAFLRRGEKETAHAMFDYQRARMEGGSVLKAAGFLELFRDFLVYESSGKLILGAGILPVWTEREGGLQVKMPTVYGEIRYTLWTVKNGWHVHVEGDARPPEGFIFHAPSGPARQSFHRLPADFELSSV